MATAGVGLAGVKSRRQAEVDGRHATAKAASAPPPGPRDATRVLFIHQNVADVLSQAGKLAPEVEANILEAVDIVKDMDARTGRKDPSVRKKKAPKSGTKAPKKGTKAAKKSTRRSR